MGTNGSRIPQQFKMNARALGGQSAISMSDEISIRELEDGGEARWDEFVEHCPDATFFHLAAWRNILQSVFGHKARYLYAEQNGAIVGVLPLAEVRSWLFGNSLQSLPFCVYGGVAATIPLATVALHSAAKALAIERGVEHLEIRNREIKEPDWPRQDLYVTFRKTLHPEIDANLAAIPRKQRAMIRKGMRNGLRTVIDNSTDRFFALYSDNVHRHGTPALPKRYFDTLLSVFGKDCEILTAEDQNGVAISSVLSFFFRDEVLPYYAGDHRRARELAGNDFKYWELMRRSCEKGYRLFDFGRSKRGTGSFDFKTNWGFEPRPLSYEYLLLRGNGVPQNNPQNPKYRALIKLWRRIPIRVANVIGPYIARNLS
jgi:FemAB-related protein (PEP-CTERM system-associated)